MTIDTNNLLWLVLLACIVPTVLLALLAVVLVRRSQQFLAPDLSALQQRFERMKQQDPNAARDVFIRKIIRRQSLGAGIIGAITSVGGIPLLPIGLIADLYLSARNQNATMQFLAWAYGIDDEQRSLKLGESLALRALDRFQITPERLTQWQTQFAGRVYRELIGVILSKSFAKLIPFAGLIIGFAVNYFSARLFATLASQYYSGNITRLVTKSRF
ncbi:MAG: hypothetical protein SF123_22750 [Chloroflexota bacterium]|nr:hypothetical protein [Chloroflexota bacterium]